MEMVGWWINYFGAWDDCIRFSGSLALLIIHGEWPRYYADGELTHG
jgi:hypothetical protein